MENLRRYFELHAKNRYAKFWLGPKPDVRDGQMVSAILSKIGYPTTQYSFDVDLLTKTSWSDAARALGFAATRSLVWDLRLTLADNSIQEALAALKSLDGTAQFFRNGNWGAVGMCWSYPVSSATFDAGLLGYDKQNAFIFWVEEED